jgi:hypothetical protein
MRHFRPLLWAVFVLISTTSSAFAVSFDEKISGDMDALPSWTLDAGNNTFTGTISIGNQFDLDSFSFFLPYGYAATLSLSVNSLTFTDTSSALGWNLSKQPGSCVVVLGGPLCHWGGQYQEVAGASYAKDLTGAISVAEGDPSLAEPVLLDSGPYMLSSYGVQTTPVGGSSSQGGTMDYTFQIQVSAVPEPSDVLLLSVGIIFVGILRRRHNPAANTAAAR